MAGFMMASRAGWLRELVTLGALFYRWFVGIQNVMGSMLLWLRRRGNVESQL